MGLSLSQIVHIKEKEKKILFEVNIQNKEDARECEHTYSLVRLFLI